MALHISLLIYFDLDLVLLQLLLLQLRRTTYHYTTFFLC